MAYFDISKDGDSVVAAAPGIKVEIQQDEFAENPWDDEDYAGIEIYAWHRSFRLGVKNPPPPDEVREAVETNADPDKLFIPLFMFEHGGVVLQTGSPFSGPDARWDSGQLGFFVVSRSVFEKEYVILEGETVDAAAARVCDACVEQLNQYLAGNVYTVGILDVETCDKCGHAHETLKDSCSGFYGRTGVADALRDMLPEGIPDREAEIKRIASEFYD